MKMEYLIVVVDDNESGLNSTINNVRRFLKHESIVLRHELVIVNNDWQPKTDTHFNDLMTNPELDMVLVDFNLDENFKGDVVIDYIRNSVINYHVPIVFYTSQDVPELVNRANNRRTKEGKNVFEGIYYSDRDSLDTKVNTILESLIKKENTIQRGRGLLLSFCSEIEGKLSEIFQLLKTYLIDKTRAKKIINKFFQQGMSREFQNKIKAQDENAIFDFLCTSECQLYTHRKILALYYIFNLNEMKAKIDPQKITIFGTLYSGILKKPSGSGLMDMRNLYGHSTQQSLAVYHDPKLIREKCREQLENIDSIIQQIKN